MATFAACHHAGVHLLAAANGRHGHALSIGFREVVLRGRMSIGHARHPARGLRGLLRRFSSINI